MEVHRQACQNCGSRELRNILVREDGERDRVYVQCRTCRAFVARYVIAPQGYYHHDRGFQSWLRGLFRSGVFESGKAVHEQFETQSEKAMEEFRRVTARLTELGKDDDLDAI